MIPVMFRRNERSAIRAGSDRAHRRIYSRTRLLDRGALQEMRAEIAKQVEEAVATAQQEDTPQAREEDWRSMSIRTDRQAIGLMTKLE